MCRGQTQGFTDHNNNINIVEGFLLLYSTAGIKYIKHPVLKVPPEGVLFIFIIFSYCEEPSIRAWSIKICQK